MEWYTPGAYIEAVREVLGDIDLDPASCQVANQVVGARHFFTQSSDGLARMWFGRVFLNPPYGKLGNTSNQERWSKHLISEYELGRVEEAILLVNAATDTIWFRRLWAYPLCFVSGRIRFWRTGNGALCPTHGSVFVYFGLKAERFCDVFSRFGVVAEAWEPSPGGAIAEK